MNALDFNTVTVPARTNSGTHFMSGMAQVQSGGVFFYCKSSSAPFLVQFDIATKIPFDQGFKRLVADSPFETVRFFNPTANPITIEFYVGNGDVDFVGVSAYKEVSSRANGAGLLTLEAGEFELFPGVDVNSQRKQIVITNLDAAAPLIICDDQGNPFGAVFASSAWTIPTDAAFQVRNNTENPINYIVGEIYYNN